MVQETHGGLCEQSGPGPALHVVLIHYTIYDKLGLLVLGRFFGAAQQTDEHADVEAAKSSDMWAMC